MSEMLGRDYQPGEDIVREGDIGDCMFVIQQGEAEIIKTVDGVPTRVDSIVAGDIFGETAIVEQTTRTATVRALTTIRALTIDRKTFLRRVQEDPALALNILKLMAGRVRRLNHEVASLKQQLERLAASGAGA